MYFFLSSFLLCRFLVFFSSLYLNMSRETCSIKVGKTLSMYVRVFQREDSQVATWCLQLRCIEFALSQLAVFVALILQTDGRLCFSKRRTFMSLNFTIVIFIPWKTQKRLKRDLFTKSTIISSVLSLSKHFT